MKPKTSLKCFDCEKEKPDVKERIDNGLPLFGALCDDCFKKLITDCRKRSW